MQTIPIYGQISDSNVLPTPANLVQDSLGLSQDTIPNPGVPNQDGLLEDGSSNAETGGSQVVKFADNDLKSELIYGAIDSQWYDNKAQLMYLYGDAFVNYENKELKADLIILDMDNKIAEAKISDAKRLSKRPTFKDGDKTYEYKRLKYNFETEKGIVYDAVTSEGEFMVHGEKTKYVVGGDNLYGTSDVIYNSNSIITTCNHPGTPHFGFKAKKLKVVTDKVAVAGPANLQISGIPTPLWIPFGFFPLTQSASSGLIFPSGFQFYTEELGFGVAGLGWYFPINDYVHTQLTGDIYSRGTWGLYSNTNYYRKYKYRGSVNLSYNDFKTETISSTEGFIKVPSRGFSIQVTHNQDGKAHPYRTLGGNIRIVGNDNINRVNTDAGSVLTSTYSSNFSFNHSMPNTPFSFRAGMSHNQNTKLGTMNITLPDAALTMKTIYPFVKKNGGANEKKWYEKIALGYNSRLKVITNTTDSTLFTQETLDNTKSGVSHDASLSLSTRVLKYFNLVPSINYDETWVLNSIENRIVQSAPFREIGPTAQDTLNWQIDSLYQTQDSVITDVLNDIGTFRNFGAGVTLSTQIYGTKTFSKGPIRGIRHLVKPSITYGYAPDRTSLVDTLLYGDNQRLAYSRFDDGPFGSPSKSSLQSQVSYRIGNVLEMKYFSRKDSTEKKFKIFDNVTLTGNYNFARDSLKMSTNSLNSTSRLFGGLTQVSSRWTFDSYILEDGVRVNKTVWSDRKKLARLTTGSINVSTNLSFKKILGMIKGKADEDEDVLSKSGSYADAGMSRTNGANPRGLIDEEEHDHDHDHDGLHVDEEEEATKKISILSLLDRFSIRHQVQYNVTGTAGNRQATLSTNSLNVTGSFDLTENWAVNIGNLGYDFVNKGPTYSTVSFIRKLHCWDMRITWTPGADNLYSFFIGVSSGTLSFLKYNYGQSNVFGGI